MYNRIYAELVKLCTKFESTFDLYLIYIKDSNGRIDSLQHVAEVLNVTPSTGIAIITDNFFQAFVRKEQESYEEKKKADMKGLKDKLEDHFFSIQQENEMRTAQLREEGEETISRVMQDTEKEIRRMEKERNRWQQEGARLSNTVKELQNQKNSPTQTPQIKVKKE